MKQIIIKNLSKSYQINKSKTRTSGFELRQEITNFLKNPLSLNSEKKKKFWALKDINFSVNQGENLGIIGLNGSGKTTLLKILAQITAPTNGEIIIKGTLTSLLGIGIGFNPNLTGRENIYLDGALLGYKKKEIDQEFKSIVDFSGLEKFIDTPVKFYSSGMSVRLAFAVATNYCFKPNILLLDEILAVGDYEYYQKCLKRMEELTNSSKTTILFVSHNLVAVRKFCHRCLWLDKGKIKAIGKSKDVINRYLKHIKALGKKKKML